MKRLNSFDATDHVQFGKSSDQLFLCICAGQIVHLNPFRHTFYSPLILFWLIVWLFAPVKGFNVTLFPRIALQLRSYRPRRCRSFLLNIILFPQDAPLYLSFNPVFLLSPVILLERNLCRHHHLTWLTSTHKHACMHSTTQTHSDPWHAKAIVGLRKRMLHRNLQPPNPLKLNPLTHLACTVRLTACCVYLSQLLFIYLGTKCPQNDSKTWNHLHSADLPTAPMRTTA